MLRRGRIIVDYLERLTSNQILVLFDLDHFKGVNDSHGHDVGDSVLCKVCRVVSDQLRDSDFLARFGGEEFIAVLPCTPLQGAEVLAERLRQSIETGKFDPDDRVTASFGTTQLGEREPADELLKRVDVALYAAKNAGRNRVVSQ